MKYVIVMFAFVLALATNAICQNIPLSTEAIVKFNFGGNSDQPETAVQAIDGSIFVGGMYCYIDSNIIRPALAKFTANGVKLWQIIDTIGSYTPALALAENGGVYWATDARTLKVGAASDIFKKLDNIVVVRCDEVQWRFLGLSLAGWNALDSLGLTAVAAWGALAALAKHKQAG